MKDHIIILATLLFCNLFIKYVFYLLTVLFKGIKAIKEHFIKKNDAIYLWPHKHKLYRHFTESLPTNLDFAFNLEETDT